MFSTQVKALWNLSTVRQTVGLLMMFLTITLLAWGGTYWLVEREMVKAVDARLIERMQAAEQALEKGQALPRPEDGQTAKIISEDWPTGFITRNSDGPGPEMRYLARNTSHGQLVLGENTERQDELRDILAGGMHLSMMASLITAVLAGLWMARRGQVRLGKINAGLAQVAKGHLDTRIVLDGHDDLSLLAGRINETTERLDLAMTQMQVQASNIAHDLRTPLARLRAHVESSLIALVETNRAVTEDNLGAALEQIDHITGTFNALLRLARIERGTGRDAFGPVDLGATAQEVTDTFRPVVEEAGQALVLETSHSMAIRGDRDLLGLMLTNLVQNALRYGPAGQTILLHVYGRRVSIRDEGPGIPISDREKVLQPLYQGETTRQGPGFGLGLSMVRAICDLHDAALSLSDGPDGRGLTATIVFPETHSGIA